VSHVYESAAINIVDWLHRAEDDLIGASIATFNGEAGTVTGLQLDTHHGLCFSIDPEPHKVFRIGEDTVRWYPVSTIRTKT
jgi:hypothetical protein